MSPIELILLASSSAADWAKHGFPTLSESQLDERQNICKSCEFWNSDGFAGSGQCKKCGCSTAAKLRMATSKCPIDKWGAIEIEQTQ